MSEKSSDLGAFLAGFVIGGLVGAATALILAPQSGEETRSRIKETSDNLAQSSTAYLHEYGQKANDLTQSYVEKANATYEGVKTQVQETGSNVQQQARTAIDASKEKATELKDQVSNQVSNIVQSSGTEGETAVNGSA